MFNRTFSFILFLGILIFGAAAPALAMEPEDTSSCSMDVSQQAHGWVTVSFSWNNMPNWPGVDFGDGQEQRFPNPSGAETFQHQYDVDANPGKTWTITPSELGHEPCDASVKVSWNAVGEPTAPAGPGPEFFDCVLDNTPLGLTAETVSQFSINDVRNTGMVRLNAAGNQIIVGPFEESQFKKVQRFVWTSNGAGSAFFRLNGKDDCNYVTQ